MTSILRTAIGLLRGSPPEADAGVYQALLEACARLDAIEPGLARQSARFVAGGEGEAVLLALARSPGPVAKALGLTETRQLKVMQRRAWRAVIGPDARWDPAVVYRLCQLFDSTAKVFQGAPWGLCGSAAGPLWLRLPISLAETLTCWSKARSEVRCPMGVFTVERCRELLALAGEPDDGLVDVLFHSGASWGGQSLVDDCPGAVEYLREMPEVVAAAATGLDAHGRVELVHTIGRLGLVDAYFGYVFDRSLDSAKSVREPARAAMHGADGERLLAAAAAVFDQGRAADRARLPELLASALGERARPLLEAERERQTGKRVREAIDAALGNIGLLGEKAPVAPGDDASGHQDGSERSAGGDGDRAALRALDGEPLEIPPLPAMPEDTRLPDHLFDALRGSAESFNAVLREAREANAKEKHHWSRYWQPISDGEVTKFRRIAHGEKGLGWWQSGRENGLWAITSPHCPCKFDRSGVERFFAAEELGVRHLVRIVYARHGSPHWTLFDAISRADDASSLALRARVAGGADFRLVVRLWSEAGGKDPLRSYLESDWGPDLDLIESESLWAYLVEHLELIDEALGMRPASGKYPLSRLAALALLERFPRVPQRYLQPLMWLATGTAKTLRVPARALLASAPHIDEPIAALLGDPKQDVRAGAADWLAARGARAQVPAIERALARERSEIARAAELTALERLGVDVSAHFDPDKLLAEARKGLGKALPKNLDWFPFDAIPNVRWASGEGLERDVVRWWVVLANKLKQPGGNALLDLYLERLAPEDASELGLFVLRAFVEHDTRRPSDAEANAYAKARAESQYQSMQRYLENLTLERVFAELKSSKASEYLTSAIANKGVLGLSALAPGPDAADVVRGFLRNHGARVAQCKALLEALAANPSSAAIQVVLATANRFKARTVQSHAQALIESIAERRGWSAEQLADRTVPTGGLDERGRLALDCGEGRLYEAVYDEEQRLVLRNPSGKVVKALPGARGEEDADQVKAAKRALSAARKEVKQVTSLQRERLFEAMCLQRVWQPEEWRRYLAAHPVLGRMCQRLIWLGLDEAGRPVRGFRLLEDGTLSDQRDGALEERDFAGVSLAHRTLIDEAAREGWLAHLADYEVEPLFDQLARTMLVLEDGADGERSIEDRRGHMIESFKLRGAATRLGYQRAEAMDGGIFTEYVKRYESAGVVAVIGFTGSPLPEENIACAMLGLEFNALGRGGGWRRAMTLGEVPPVLLSETWNDYREIAAAGTGFDAKWEKKAEYW